MSAIGHQGVFRLDGWSRQIHTEFQGFRATWGNDHEGNTYAYTAITHSGQPSQAVQLRIPFITRRETSSSPRSAPQPPACNACQLSHTPGLACSAFARHYSRNHNCFLFLWVLRCFTSPRSLQHPYTFRMRSPDTTPDIRGFPIRRSTDQSSFTSSPWLIAGYNVLHRLLMPRHPPTALSSLSPNKTINKIYKDARVHYTILKQQTNTRTPTPHTGASTLAPSIATPTTFMAEVPEPNNVPPPNPNQEPGPLPHPPQQEVVLNTRTPTRIRLGQCLPQKVTPATHTTHGHESRRPPSSDTG